MNDAKETNRRLKEINKQLLNEQIELKCKLDIMTANVLFSVVNLFIVRRNFFSQED